MKLAAIFTTYRPDVDFRKRIDNVFQQCVVTIVVDNTPGGHTFSDCSDLIIIQDGINKGLGAAINIGIRKAGELGADSVILFDQDSSPEPSFITRMVSGLRQLQSEYGLRVCAGPLHLDDETGKAKGFRRAESQGSYVELSCLPTSGMMFSLRALPSNWMFSEDLFLDLVDFDWCWRMRTAGWRVFRCLEVKMLHRLGLGERKFLGITYHVPAPYRHYFQFRDTLRLAFKRQTPLYSKLRLLSILPAKLLVYPFLLDAGRERFFWMVRGIIDALRNINGIGAAADRLQRRRPSQ